MAQLMALGHGVHRNYQSFLVDYLGHLTRHGVRVESRSGPTTELIHQTFTILRPRERFTALNTRRNNPIATIAETMWVLAGRDDIEYLSRYLPRASQFSDDGFTWRAAYGPRLRAYGLRDIDQVKKVSDIIKVDRNTRRAVVSIWNPELDWVDSKDIPCNDLLTFQVRGGQLHMTATIRSQDIIWGSMVNMFEWSVLQEAIAAHVGVDVGMATYMVGSLHLYDRHLEMAHNIIREGAKAFHPIYDENIDRLSMASSITTPINVLDMDIQRFMDAEVYSREKHNFNDLMIMCSGIVNPFVRDSAIAVAAYNAFRTDKDFSLSTYIDEMEGFDIRASVYEYIFKLQRNEELRDEQNTKLGIAHGSAHSEESIVTSLVNLQAAKSMLYKDSWKKHGELISIFPNISRKYDRIISMTGSGQLVDRLTGEDLVDTIGDLAVYCCLYASWLSGNSFEEEMSTLKLNWTNTELEGLDNNQKNATVIYKIKEIYQALEDIILSNRIIYGTEKLDKARALAAWCVKWLSFAE